MAKRKTANKETPAPKRHDEELQNAVIALLESGDDDGCEGTIVCGIEEFRKVREMIHDRTGDEYGNVTDDNVRNFAGGDDDEDKDDFSEQDDDEPEDEWDDHAGDYKE